jgi:hypothetical protein
MDEWQKQSCSRTTLHGVSQGPKEGLITNHLNTSFKQGLIAHDSHASIKLELTRLGLCIHVPAAPHGTLHTAKGMSIVVLHLKSIDSRLYRTCAMVHCHVRRCRSCIPLYNAIEYQGDDRQTSTSSVEWPRAGPTRRSSSTTSGPSSKIWVR